MSREKFPFTYDNIHIEYVYKDAFINWDFSIHRTVKITNTDNDKLLTIDLLPDIESLDEPRFFHVKRIEFDDIKYDNTLVIRDPFALAIIDMNSMKAIYNSHGEDDIENRLIIHTEESCIGKISKRKLILGDCEIGF